jgi:GT2 family glycosyltransferase
MNSIPCIGTAVVNTTKWLRRLVDSIDYPVDNFFIVNNNGRGQLDQELEEIKQKGNPFIKNIAITNLPANIGCGGAWNLIIKCYMNSPYWIIVGDDIAFGPGILEEMATTVKKYPTAGLVHGHAGDFNVGSWEMFLIRDFVIQEYGLFDENLYPAYCEDADYIMRLIHKPIHKIMSLKNKYYHGPGEVGSYYEHGSQTKKSDTELGIKLDTINQKNIEYLTKKWGEGWRMCAPTRTPFEGKEHSISECTYDLNFAREKHLGF